MLVSTSGGIISWTQCLVGAVALRRVSSSWDSQQDHCEEQETGNIKSKKSLKICISKMTLVQ